MRSINGTYLKKWVVRSFNEDRDPSDWLNGLEFQHEKVCVESAFGVGMRTTMIVSYMEKAE
jgi:hypothetical protein